MFNTILTGVIPSLGHILDNKHSLDNLLTYTTAATLLVTHLPSATLDDIAQQLLGSLQGSDGEPLDTVTRINEYLDNRDLGYFDLIFWLLQENILADLMKNKLFAEMANLLGIGEEEEEEEGAQKDDNKD
jgi:hypothetical protein